MLFDPMSSLNICSSIICGLYTPDISLFLIFMYGTILNYNFLFFANQIEHKQLALPHEVCGLPFRNGNYLREMCVCK